MKTTYKLSPRLRRRLRLRWLRARRARSTAGSILAACLYGAAAYVLIAVGLMG